MKDHSPIFKHNRFLNQVKQTIATFEMIRRGDAVLVGVSGGPDSVALLHALCRLSGDLSFTLGAVHMNHCLRGKDSDNDAAFVSSLCSRLHVPCHTVTEDVRAYKKKHGLSLEEASRRVRYDVYFRTATAGGFNRIALGHHQDDNAELILMHLFRGSGPLGVSGIPPVRNHQNADLKIIRPLMELDRARIIEFINANDLPYVTDQSNLDPSHLRNKIRNDLLPMLKAAYNPKITETLNRLASIIRCEEKWIDDRVQSLFDKTCTTYPDGGISFSVHSFNQLPDAAKRRILRKAVGRVKGNTRRISLAHIDAILSFLTTTPGSGSLDLPDRIRAKKDNDNLTIIQEKQPLRDTDLHPNALPYEYRIGDPAMSNDPTGHPEDPVQSGHGIKSASVHIKEVRAQMRITKMNRDDLPDMKHTHPRVAFFDYDKLCFPLVIRNVMPGDRFTPLGMAGTQKVMRFFMNQKVPKQLRRSVPLLLSHGNIIWVAGHRMDDRLKVMPSTRNVLKAELFLA